MSNEVWEGVFACLHLSEEQVMKDVITIIMHHVNSVTVLLSWGSSKCKPPNPEKMPRNSPN